MAGLSRPNGLADEAWAGISETEARLLRARAEGDRPLVVGAAKELCEAVARVIVVQRGETLGAAADMPELISAAHKLVEYQPGEGLANDPESRKIAQGLKSIVLGLSEMRNRHGTGHGRGTPSSVVEEHATLAYEAALLWSRWALQRLEPYIAGDVGGLVRELGGGGLFHRGELAHRLKLANLARLSYSDQRRLGVAVARRASQGTFVVGEDGITAVQPEDAQTWPPGYVEGLAMGLFFDANGRLELKAWIVSEVARLVTSLVDPLPVIRQLMETASKAGPSYGLVEDEEVMRKTLDEFRKTALMLPAQGESRQLWQSIPEALTMASPQ